MVSKKQAPVGKAFEVNLLSFDENAYQVHTFSVLRTVHFYPENYNAHTFQQAVQLAVGALQRRDFSENKSIVHYHNDANSSYTFDGTTADFANFKMREGVKNRPEKMTYTQTPAGNVLTVWKTAHWEPNSWTEHYYQYTEGKTFTSQHPDWVEKNDCCYASATFVASDCITLYQTAKEKKELEL